MRTYNDTGRRALAEFAVRTDAMTWPKFNLH